MTTEPTISDPNTGPGQTGEPGGGETTVPAPGGTPAPSAPGEAAPAPVNPDPGQPAAPAPATVGNDTGNQATAEPGFHDIGGDATLVGAAQPPYPTTANAGANPGTIDHNLPQTATGDNATPAATSTPHADPVADEFAALEAEAAKAHAEAAQADAAAPTHDPGEAPAVANVDADKFAGPNPAASDGKWGSIPGQGRYEPIETGVNP